MSLLGSLHLLAARLVKDQSEWTCKQSNWYSTVPPTRPVLRLINDLFLKHVHQAVQDADRDGPVAPTLHRPIVKLFDSNFAAVVNDSCLVTDETFD